MRTCYKTRQTKIYCFFGEKVTNTLLYTEISAIATVHSYEKIRSYLQDNKEKIEFDMSFGVLNNQILKY